jgi:hypothetical protein
MEDGGDCGSLSRRVCAGHSTPGERGKEGIFFDRIYRMGRGFGSRRQELHEF